MNSIVDNYPLPANFSNMEQELKDIKERSLQLTQNADVLESIFNSIDLTTLNSTDSTYSVTEFVEKVNQFAKDYPTYKNVAAVVTFPAFAPVLDSTLKVKDVAKAVVSAGFPSSQTFSDLKRLETQKALDFGADEIDIVISVGEFIEGNHEFVSEEIAAIHEIMGNAKLKVIIETGALRDSEDVWVASLLSMLSGADIIKTSTGKGYPGASPEAAYAICHAIKHYYNQTRKKVGFKASGGVASIEDAVMYYQIVKDILGDEWLNNSLFRIGASRLANTLLSKLVELKEGKVETINYF